jgi:uncharacterized protein YndB with AHSA1/START domain
VTVVAVTKDPAARTMTIAARFDAPIERVWELWSDPRQLERWWSPPDYPAKVLEHDLRPGGTVTYVMTGAEGDEFRDWWKVRTVDPPRYLEFDNGFADESGEPNPDLPTTVTRVTLAESASGGTDMEIVFVFGTLEAMEQMIAMGMEAGLTAAVGQIDELLGHAGH